VLHADVQGSEFEPYHVMARARGDRLSATCDCPYAEEWGAWCKHVVATLLTALRHGDAIPERPTVSALVAPLERDALVRLLETLVEHAPPLYEIVRAAASSPARR